MKVNVECRMCRSRELFPFLDLGSQPLANAFLKKEDLDKPEPRYPLRVFFCEYCGLSQLVDIVDPEVLFGHYVYFSSYMPKVSEHWRRYAEETVQKFTSQPKDFVVEIGSNDGMLLGEIQKLGRRVLGVDPARNIAKIANERGVPTVPEFFSQALAKGLVGEHGAAQAVIGNNVVAHIDNHQDLLAGVSELLAPGGVFIFEAPYLVDMVENLTFDTVYHEHLSYLSVRPLVSFLGRYGLEIFDVKLFPVQGNSLRVYAGRKGRHAIQSSVAEFLKKEQLLGMDKLSTYVHLAKQVANLKEKVLRTLWDLKKQGRRLAGYGAPAKGNTLLNYFGIGPDLLEYATEALPSKIGSYTPGMHIPVVGIHEARKHPPDYYVLLAWNYKNVILEKEQSFRSNGGKFIMPVGTGEIL